MTISVFGFGDFGQLVTRYLVPRADVLVYDRNGQHTADIVAAGAQPVSLERACAAEIIILAVPLSKLEQTLRNMAPFVRPGVLVVDTTSVKLKPIQLMEELLPQHCQILATHPLFGPQSAAQSLAGHKIVVQHVRVKHPEPIEEFLRSLGLTIIHMTADEHDKEMAWVHALTFFVGRGVLNLDPPTSDLGTNYYNKLTTLIDLERQQSLDLFYTIQRGNPYAKAMRRKLIDELERLEDDIESEEL